MGYKLKVHCGYSGCDWEMDVSDLVDDKVFERYKETKLTEDECRELENQALELSSFEWWVVKE